MKCNLRKEVVEWVLAGWAGHEKDPDTVFPDLGPLNVSQLRTELQHAIEQAREPMPVS